MEHKYFFGLSSCSSSPGRPNWTSDLLIIPVLMPISSMTKVISVFFLLIRLQLLSFCLLDIKNGSPININLNSNILR